MTDDNRVDEVKSVPRADRGPRADNPRGVVVATGSTLTEKCWAVIADHYVSFDLTHEAARAEAVALRERKQPGVVIVTNDAAKRMVDGAAGAKSADAPDMRF